MAISDTVAQWALTAKGAPTRTNIGSTVTIGQALSRKEWTDADIAYSVKAECTTTSDVATVTVSSGAIAATTGSPTLTDSAVDFEGKTTATMVNIYACLVQCVTNGNCTVGGGASEPVEGELKEAGDILMFVSDDGTSVAGMEVTLDLNEVGGVFEVTIIGKSS